MLFSSKKPSDTAPSRRREIDNAKVQAPVSSPRRTFRRNQTLTGSTSANITSSAEFSAQMQSPRAQAHHLHRHRRRLSTRLAVVLIAALALYVFIGQIVASTTISTEKGGTISDSQSMVYENAIDQYLNQRPSERFYPTLNQSALLGFLQSKHPEVEAVDVSLSGVLGQVETRLVFRQPVAKWSIDGNREYVDAKGYVFDINAYAEPPVEIVDQAGASAGQGIVTSNRFLSFVGQVVGDMGTRGFVVKTATIPLLTTRQIELGIDGVGYPVRMATDRPSSEQTEDAARVIGHLRERGLTPGYVDVRVSGKAFYK